MKLGIRPDYATLAANGLPVQVRRVDDLGRKRLAHVTLGGQPLVATVPNGMSIEGSEARVRLDPARTHIYVDDHRVEGSRAWSARHEPDAAYRRCLARVPSSPCGRRETPSIRVAVGSRFGSPD